MTTRTEPTSSSRTHPPPSKATGSHWAFFVAGVLVVASLAVLGVEIANVAISIVTLLMVFVLQNTQNRESAEHLKLDEVVKAEPEARDAIRGAETMSQEEIEELHEKLHSDVAG